MTRATNHILPMYLMFFESNMRPADEELDGAVVSATHAPALHFLPMSTRLLSARTRVRPPFKRRNLHAEAICREKSRSSNAEGSTHFLCVLWLAIFAINGYVLQFSRALFLHRHLHPPRASK